MYDSPVSIDPNTLLSTVTGEAFQPVRLYYAIPSKAVVAKVFKRLKCMDEDKDAGCWVWLYEKEAARLRFGNPREDLPAAAHPIVIGRFHIDGAGTGMFLAVRSNERAFEAAKFFRPLLGSKVRLARVRIVNHWFKVSEMAAGLDKLDALLDADVTSIDRDADDAPSKKKAAARAIMADPAAAMHPGLPLIEDFPLHPEDATPGFDDLKLALQLRQAHAEHRWRGSHASLFDIIKKAVAAKGKL